MRPDLFEKRVVELNTAPIDENGQCIIYWMQRSQRAMDNPALEFAIELANDLSKPVLVYFGLYDDYPQASQRTFKFMLEGLAETSGMVRDIGCGFCLRRENPSEGIVRAANEFKACAVVVDEDYLNVGRSWRSSAASKLPVRLYQVDAETVVPARITDKEEWGAYTLRPKIAKVLNDYLVEPENSTPSIKWTSEVDCIDLQKTNIESILSTIKANQDVPPSPYFTGGYTEGYSRLDDFINNDLPRYKTERNEIGVSVSSDLSPYFHFSQISSLRTALTVEKSDAPVDCIDAFIEQLIVRREISINFCLYNPNYNLIEGAADWARRTIDEHRSDPRYTVYTLEELENARTQDDLWNASQMELVRFGKIHPYMRMVWGKAIMEWSDTPEEALARTIYLNDKYALDGRDPTGYTNIAWCIYGKHDRPFAERPIFGKVRYMSTSATKRKTDWSSYISRIQAL